MPSHHLLPDADLTAVDVPLLVVGAFSGDDGPVLDATGAALSETLGFDLAAAAAATGFEGGVGKVARVPAGDAVTAALVVVAGLGARDEVDTRAVRIAATAAAGVAERRPALASTLSSTTGVDPDEALRAAVEGFHLGAHRFRMYKTDDHVHQLADVHHVGPGSQDALDLGVVSADATALVRDLANTAPVDKRPPAFAERATELVADLPVEVTILDEAALTDGGYGGHLGVGAGSTAESRLVQLDYRPDGATTHVTLVGKGITFDSGGLSLKPPKAQEWMKVDMAGAATVLAVVRAAAALSLPVAVTGLLCLAENMPSGSATRPGDVLTILGGTTVEVLNTDAEGRLVLADGLVHAGRMDPAPDVIVDLATLTGGVIAALGPKYTGLMTEDDDVGAALLAAAAVADEPMWQLPMGVQEYDEELKSDIADIRNVGGTGASTTRAALFLRRFRPDGIPWAHLDIAGASWNDGGPFDGIPKGATGRPARTMVDWLRAL